MTVELLPSKGREVIVDCGLVLPQPLGMSACQLIAAVVAG